MTALFVREIHAEPDASIEIHKVKVTVISGGRHYKNIGKCPKLTGHRFDQLKSLWVTVNRTEPNSGPHASSGITQAQQHVAQHRRDGHTDAQRKR